MFNACSILSGPLLLTVAHVMFFLLFFFVKIKEQSKFIIFYHITSQSLLLVLNHKQFASTEIFIFILFCLQENKVRVPHTRAHGHL